MQSVAIDTKVVSLISVHDEVYSIQHFGTKFVFSGFPINKTDHHGVAEILLKLALNTITLTLTPKLTHVAGMLTITV